MSTDLASDLEKYIIHTMFAAHCLHFLSLFVYFESLPMTRYEYFDKQTTTITILNRVVPFVREISKP